MRFLAGAANYEIDWDTLDEGGPPALRQPSRLARLHDK
jgi:hypothetical protein